MKKADHSIVVDPSEDLIWEIATTSIEEALDKNHHIVLIIAKPDGFEICSSLEPEQEVKFLTNVIATLISNLDENTADLVRAFGEAN